MKILVIGLCSSGNIDGNIGNYIIVHPFFKLLRKYFPEDEIKTPMNIPESLFLDFNIIPIKHKRFLNYGKETAKNTLKDIFKFFIFKLTKKTKYLKNSPLLNSLYESDLIIDFSGDIYGDNANWKRYLETNVRLFFAIHMKKKIAMIIGSPGPFTKMWRLLIAKYILPKLNLITNREEISTSLLEKYRINNPNMHTAACPSIFFEKSNLSKIKHKKDYEIISNHSNKILGIIICGWNMQVGPCYKWPREKFEYLPFIELINYIYDNTDYKICLMSHQNASDKKGNLVFGNDHRIIFELMSFLEDYKKDRIFTLKDVYNAEDSKTIIGMFELLISGRVHGAVQGLSQCIPTAIIDYGHEPKAHKMRGFSRIYGVEDFLCDPKSSSDMIEKVKRLISEKEYLKNRLEKRIPFIKEKAIENFLLLKQLSEV